MCCSVLFVMFNAFVRSFKMVPTSEHLTCYSNDNKTFKTSISKTRSTKQNFWITMIFPDIHLDALKRVTISWNHSQSNETKIHSSELTFVGWQPFPSYGYFTFLRVFVLATKRATIVVISAHKFCGACARSHFSMHFCARSLNECGANSLRIIACFIFCFCEVKPCVRSIFRVEKNKRTT